MADLTQTLIAAAQADRTAEQRLTEWLNANYGELAKALVAELTAEGKPLEARQMASIYLKNTLYGKTAKTCHEYRNRWMQLDAATRSVIKEGLLMALKSNEQGVPHFCTLPAAEVATVELPFNEWPEYVPTLTANIEGAATGAIPQAALECFGFTLERIAEVEEQLDGDVPELGSEIVDKMLTSIVSCVQPNKPAEIKLAALTALKNSLLFVRKNFDVPAERDFIMKHAIMNATQEQASEKLRSLAFNCLDQVAELYYDKLADYMTDIFQLTTRAIEQDPSDQVKMSAIEFWNSVAICEQTLQDEEALAGGAAAIIAAAQALGQEPPRTCQKYTQTALPSLVPLLLQTLTTQEEDADEDMDELGLNTSGSICLETISQTVEAAIIPLVLPFVQQHINSADWHYRDAAIVAFSCILDGPETAAVRSFVSDIIGVLLGAFNDPHETVRQSAVHCIATICRLHVGAIPSNQVNGIMEAVVLKLKESPRVATYACTAIYNIARAIKTNESALPEPPTTNVLSPMLMPVLQALFEVSDRAATAGESNNLRANSMEAVAELIGASAADCHGILVQLQPSINERADQALKLPVVSGEDNETKMQLLGSLCIIYNALFTKLPKADVLPAANDIMNNLVAILQIPNAACHDEVFMAIGNLANIIEEEFAKYLSHVVPLVVQGIRNFEAISLCKVSVGTLVDIATNVGGEIQPYCDQVMTALMECLKDNTAHRSLKPVVLSCLGDIAMAICGAFEPYLQVTTMFLMQAAQQTPPADNDDAVIFINELRYSVLEAYSGILIGLADGNKLELFLPICQNVMPFLEYLANPASNRDDDVLKKAVMLLGDIAKELGGKHQAIKQQLLQPFVMNLLTTCNTIGDEESRSTAAWTHTQVHNALQAGP